MNLRDAIRRRFAAPEWALFTEVQTGHNPIRYADYVAVNLWHSRGHEIVGMEVKTDRADWLREKNDPAKAEATARYCDAFWLVTTNHVANPDEVPVGWGLLVLKGERLYTMKSAVDLNTMRPGHDRKTLQRSFFAALVRRAMEDKDNGIKRVRDEAENTDFVRAEVEKARVSGREAWEKAINKVQAELEHEREFIKAFEESAGVTMQWWNRGSWEAKLLGDAVKFVREGGLREQASKLVALAGQAKHLAEVAQAAAEVANEMRQVSVEPDSGEETA